ncbi:uncharacterized protein LOC130498784 [Raphanus sativus]|uniref:Uncharacterized protein LOC130498784 n=1 Tax=Raphanus sativus TaxID=3726 RepID=A0A9W3CA08_RAPSA|nr:uncharacterized protein LOC130498784 [Raphanus sativus]
MNKFVPQIFPGWSAEDNYSFSPLGKIWLIWHPSLLVTVISKSLQMITVEIIWPTSTQPKFYVSLVYASNNPAERALLWSEISSLATTLGLDKKPWLILGDFNQTRDPAEHSKPPTLKIDKKCRDFNDCLLTANLDDLNFRGTTYTWWNKQKLAPIAKKLDRTLVNDEWLACYPSSVAFVGNPDFSDHAVITVTLDPEIKRTKKPFRFYNFLLQNPEFLVLICESWYSINVMGSAMFRLSRKLKLLKNIIREFSKQNYSGIEIKTEKAHEKLLRAQTAMLSAPNTANAADELQALHEWEELFAAETSFFYQRSHINWLSCGDGNSRLFHRYAATRQAINHIHFLISCSGERIDSQAGGPDGYSAEFFTACWSIIGPEVTDAILEFFRSGKLLKQWNAANLVLIPKKPNASHPSEFRPISCLNTVYKVISKLLATRLQEILPLMVSKSQSAFLPGRLLAENVLLATDLVNGYNRETLSPRGMLKVDLRKAFDCVRWDFIAATLRAIGVPVGFITLISECISTASFSVCINGVTGGLSRLLTARYDAGLIGYHPRTEHLRISHLMFADDVMVFFDGSSNSLHGIAECLDDFASWSGLHTNPSKTEIFTAGLDHCETEAIISYGFPTGQFPIRYLGLPLMSRKLKISEYSALLSKLTAIFKSWSVKLLSFAGRLQLLKTVIFGTVSFWLSAFILPKGCIKSIESLCSRFLWSGNIEKKGIAKVDWNTVCLPKEEGGLGLRNFTTWNHVLCLKFIWLILSKSPSLWVDWHQSVHLNEESFWTIEASAADSWAWRKLLDLRPLALQFCKLQLGNGLSASFWYDVWSPLGQLIKHIGEAGPRALRTSRSAKVADVIRGSTWILPHPRSQKEVDLHAYLTTIPLPLPLDEIDIYEWVAGDSPLRVFRSAITWEVLRPKEEIKDWTDVVWFKGGIPKHSFTMWIANYDRLPTRSRLASWGLQISPLCPFCSSHDEDRDHLLLACDYSREVWKLVVARCSPPISMFSSWQELLSWIRASPSKKLSLLRKLAVYTTIFHLWKQRNNLIHNQTSISAAVVFHGIAKEMKNIISARKHIKGFGSLMVMWLS